MKSFAFLFWAYNVIWLLIAGYVLWIAARLGRVGRRLDAVERSIERREADGAQRSSRS